MAWHDELQYQRLFGNLDRDSRSDRGFQRIDRCMVRQNHQCGKYLGASKSCFVACPTADDLEPTLELVKEKLTKLGVEPVIAIKERAYGQDIFCTKICGKIIEAQFCVVVLDDSSVTAGGSSVAVPNPNVYYEYGIMTALNKHVIPLQKEGQTLAFNIQTHDTIRYASRNLGAELDLAFRDAIRWSETEGQPKQAESLSIRLVNRCLEIAGFREKQSSWFFYDDLRDTMFRGYSATAPGGYVFFAIMRSADDLSNLLLDMQVVIRRVETYLQNAATRIEEITQVLAEMDEQIAVESRRVPRAAYERPRMADELKKMQEKGALLRESSFAVVLPGLPRETAEKLAQQYEALVVQHYKPALSVGDESGIVIGDDRVEFKELIS